MFRFTKFGGLVASLVLIAMGVGALTMGLDGRSEVRSNLAAEKIVGSPDMTKIAGQKVDTGAEAREFAKVMREHTLAITGGKTYAEMPRFLGKDGKPTGDEKAAALTDKGKPMDNPARQIWVTSTALTTALNTAFFAEQVAMFSIVMGIALLLAGIGFLVLTLRVMPARQGQEVLAVQTAPAPARA